MTNVNFMGYKCELKFGKYNNGRTALQLFSPTEGPVATATVNLVDVSNKQFEQYAKEMKCSKEKVLIIKNWSENEGILGRLEKAGIISSPFFKVKTGFVHADICKLNIEIQ